MPQGSSTSPGLFVKKVIDKVTKGLEQVVACLGDVIVFDSDPSTHVKTIRALFERLRKHNLKLSPSKARLGATDADSLGHSISLAGVRSNADKVSALTLMPMPRDLNQLQSLLGGLSYYRKFLPGMSRRIRPITALLKKGLEVLFTPSMEAIVRDMLAELAALPVLVFPDQDAVENGSRSFRVYHDPRIDCFVATLEQGQPDGSVRPIAYVSRATLDSERHWTPLDLEAGSIVRAVKRLRGRLWGTKFRIFSDHKALANIEKVGDHNARVRKWPEHLTVFDYTLEYGKRSANGNAGFLSWLPQPVNERDRSVYSRLTSVDDEACSLPSHRFPALAWVGWCPNPTAPSWVGSPLPPLIFAILVHTGHV